MTKIDDMLSDLICKQDEVTHMNAKGRECAPETQVLIDERNAIMDRIREYVELLRRMAKANI